MISNAGNRMIGRSETTPRAKPLFVHKTTRSTMTPSSALCVGLKMVFAKKKTTIATTTDISIFFICMLF